MEKEHMQVCQDMCRESYVVQVCGVREHTFECCRCVLSGKCRCGRVNHVSGGQAEERTMGTNSVTGFFTVAGVKTLGSSFRNKPCGLGLKRVWPFVSAYMIREAEATLRDASRCMPRLTCQVGGGGKGSGWSDEVQYCLLQRNLLSSGPGSSGYIETSVGGFFLDQRHQNFQSCSKGVGFGARKGSVWASKSCGVNLPCAVARA